MYLNCKIVQKTAEFNRKIGFLSVPTLNLIFKNVGLFFFLGFDKFLKLFDQITKHEFNVFKLILEPIYLANW